MRAFATITLATLLTMGAALGVPQDSPGGQAAARKDRKAADEPAGRWYVYRDSDSEENHGEWTNWMPAEAKDMKQDFSLTDEKDPFQGSSCIRMSLKFLPPDWCGLAVSCKADYWGEADDDSAFDLRKAQRLVFYARGAKGGERVQVKVGVLGDKPFGDSAKKPLATPQLTLSKSWRRYELKARPDVNLSRVVTPFCIVANRANNTDESITVYFDQIYFEGVEGQ